VHDQPSTGQEVGAEGLSFALLLQAEVVMGGALHSDSNKVAGQIQVVECEMRLTNVMEPAEARGGFGKAQIFESNEMDGGDGSIHVNGRWVLHSLIPHRNTSVFLEIKKWRKWYL
jgi:hypothetical protein